MRFKLFGSEIYISFLFGAVVVIMIATDKTGLILPSLFSICAHETGHLFAMWLYECQPKRIKLIPASVQIVNGKILSEKAETMVALFGPLVNIILFFSLYVNYLLFKTELSLNSAFINLVIALFNLIPIIGLDGGTVLKNRLLKTKSHETALKIMRLITVFVSLIIILVAIVLTVKDKLNISLYIMGAYFLIIALLRQSF